MIPEFADPLPRAAWFAAPVAAPPLLTGERYRDFLAELQLLIAARFNAFLTP